MTLFESIKSGHFTKGRAHAGADKSNSVNRSNNTRTSRPRGRG